MLIFNTKLIAGLATAILSATLMPSNSDEIVIRNDHGGSVFAYAQKAKSLRGHKVRISGYCGSACTFYLQPRFGLNVCVERNTVLGFHMPYMMRGKYIIVGKRSARWAEERWNDWFLQHYRGELRKTLEAATYLGMIPNISIDGTGNGYFSLKASEYFPLCE